VRVVINNVDIGRTSRNSIAAVAGQVAIRNTASVPVRNNVSDASTTADFPGSGSVTFTATSVSRGSRRRSPDRGPAFGGPARYPVGQ
jgi:hypothetical protein